MKKTFTLSHPKIKYPRLIEAAKNEAKKYLKRERNKALPDDADFWDFDCKYGTNEQDAEVIHVAEINKYISQAEAQQLDSFYLEIQAKPAKRSPRPVADTSEDTEQDTETSAEAEKSTPADPWTED
ncbi:DUF6172 family protein [Oceanospirillum sediminis]|uniref:DUF6172 family protein n=1 Tax=Oceanospirillum sediminis TaxID=2760088 RepID=UPI001C720D89|nr:DUF6172 family protein [Oceanospirillum sediminis]